MRATQSPPMMTTLILLTAFSIIVQNMFLPSLSAMAQDFGVSYATANTLVAGFLFVTAGVSFFLGPLSDYYGRRLVMIWSFAIFCAATLGCLFAQSFELFLIFRMIQTVVVAGLLLSRAILRDLFDDKGAAKKIAQLSMAMAVVPMLAPIMGGVLQETFGWRANFVAFLGIGLALLGLVIADLGETAGREFTSFRDQIKTYPTILKSRRFWGYTLTVSFSIGTFYTFLGAVPVIGETLLDLKPREVGFFLGIITAGFFCGNFVSSKLSDHMAFPKMMILGRSASLFGALLGISLISLGWVSPITVIGCGIFAGFGNGLTIPVGNTGIMSVNPKLAGSAAGSSSVVFLLISAICSLLAGIFAADFISPYTLPVMLAVISAVGLLCAIYTHWAEGRVSG